MNMRTHSASRTTTTSAINSIDLNEDNEYDSITTYASASPTISMRTAITEFGDPDNKGHAKNLKNHPHKSMMGQIQTVMGSVIGK